MYQSLFYDQIENRKEQEEITNFETIKKFDELKLIRNHNSNVSSFLTIQEGCDKFCKFCVVPYTRGPEYSRNFQEILGISKKTKNAKTTKNFPEMSQKFWPRIRISQKLL